MSAGFSVVVRPAPEPGSPVVSSSTSTILVLNPPSAGGVSPADVAAAVAAHSAASDPHGDRAYTAGAVSAHEADTTNVHGIADTSALLDTGDIGVSVQGYSAVLAATTASFTTADESKLDGIEAGADVTDATNVAAAGAVMGTLVDAKGDLLVATAADTVARLPVGGTDGHVLTVDSAETAGVKWAAASGGGGASSGPALQTITAGYRYAFEPGQGTVQNWNASGITADRLYYEPWTRPLDKDIRITNIGVRVTTAQAGATFRLGIVEINEGLTPLDLALDAGTVSAASLGWKEVSGLTTVLAAGKLYSPVLITATAGVSLARAEWGVFGHDSTANQIIRFMWRTSAASQHTALSDPPPAPDGTDSGSTHVGLMRHVMVRWEAV